jgi:NADH dehydrogenase
MSCQHATRPGAFASNNAAAELLGLPARPYHQKVYAMCLHLGAASAVLTLGWDRKVDAEAKAYKKQINTVCIYPPRAAALASADPERVGDL